MMKSIGVIVLLSGLLIACNNDQPTQATSQETVTVQKQPAPTTTVVDESMILPPIDTTAINYPLVARLQGIWRRDQAPFSKVEFKQQAVRFIPAGELPAEPTFEPFQIAATCPYSEGDAGMGDFLVLPMGNECLIMALVDNKLTLSYLSGSDLVYYKEE